jgi:acetyl esterase/lipase
MKSHILHTSIMKSIKGLIILALTAITMTVSAQQKFEMDLWNGHAPNNNGDAKDIAKVYVYLPKAQKATGRAIVMCPGGGYGHLSMDNEGKDWAPYFNNMGIATIVLKYRMPHGNHEVPISDAEMAIKMVRTMAKSWNINPNDVGIMGFSAGGHLASTIATHSKGDAKPNFQILFYPVITMNTGFTHKGSHDNFLGKNASKKLEKEYSNDLQVTRVTPKAFIALADDDHAVLPTNGVNYYFELYRHDIHASLHVYPSGGHGFGIRPSFRYHSEMLLELKAWLESF